MELFSTNNLLEEELIIQNNLTGNDFDLDTKKGECICLLWADDDANAIPGLIGLIC